MEVISSASKLVKGVEFIDLYESEKLGFGKKSLTFTIDLADKGADLTDEAADNAMAKILKHLDEKLGIKIRS